MHTRGANKSDSDDIEKLITKVCSNFVKQMETKLDERLCKFEDKLSTLYTSIDKFEPMITKNTAAILDVQDRLDDLEQKYKNNCIRICGLKRDNSLNLVDSVISFLKNNLNISCSSSDIDFAIPVNNKNKDQINTMVLVRFASHNKKNTVMAERKILKNQGVVIYEDLTPKRYELLVASKKKYGKNVWSSSGKIYYWDTVDNRKTLIFPKLNNIH